MAIDRRLHQLYAWMLGYFWLPCPLCGREFGGHEWRERDGLPASIPIPGQVGRSRGICPKCTQAGRGLPASRG